MSKGKHLNALLMEIVIAVLLFMLSATVILQGFAAVRTLSDRAGASSVALGHAQSLADQAVMCEDLPALMETLGLSEAGGLWAGVFDGYELMLSITGEETTEAGMLRSMEVAAAKDGEILFTLPCARYFPREAE